MSRNIIIAGAGHGGLTAAYHLAKNGFNVTVYERAAQESDLGYEWEDFFDARTFDEAEIPAPETGLIPKVPISFYGPDPEVEPICQTFESGETEMHMNRKELCAHLIRIAKEAGVQFVFGCTINAPVMIGSRIVGISTSLGDFNGDLVIDACGVDSPLRTNLPEYLGIQKSLKTFEYIYAYRAYFNRLEGFEDVKNEYKTYFVDDGNSGLTWVVTTEKTVDLLIARFEPFGQDEIDRMYKIFKADNPHLGETLVLGGQVTKIPLRHPIAVMVADGYASIGDSACMTVPIAGSGIANSLRAGRILAKTVSSDKNEEYSASTLWKYQLDFFDNIGGTMGMIDLGKGLLLSLKKEDFDFFFRNHILTSEDLSFNTNETSAKTMFAHFTPTVIMDRLKKIGANRSLLKRIGGIAAKAGRLKLILSRIPEKYERDEVIKWAEKYEKLFSEKEEN